MLNNVRKVVIELKTYIGPFTLTSGYEAVAIVIPSDEDYATVLVRRHVHTTPEGAIGEVLNDLRREGIINDPANNLLPDWWHSR